MCAKHLDAATEVRCVSADPQVLCFSCCLELCWLASCFWLSCSHTSLPSRACRKFRKQNACHAVLCVCLVTYTPFAHPASLSLQLASRGELEDSNKYVQVILDMLVQDESEPGMEVKAKTIALLSTWCVCVQPPCAHCVSVCNQQAQACMRPCAGRGASTVPAASLSFSATHDAWAMCLGSHMLMFFIFFLILMFHSMSFARAQGIC